MLTITVAVDADMRVDGAADRLRSGVSLTIVRDGVCAAAVVLAEGPQVRRLAAALSAAA